LRRSLLTGIFTGILQANGPWGGFFDGIFHLFSGCCASKSLLNGTGIFVKIIREFLASIREAAGLKRANEASTGQL
jgi:hypothetical protein